MEKSGYKTESVPYINIDLEFFDGHDINRAALSTFEKEIIKAHMYQKHLWEFMGTTGSMTVISKTAMRQDGFVYESYLPLEYPLCQDRCRLMEGHLYEVYNNI